MTDLVLTEYCDFCQDLIRWVAEVEHEENWLEASERKVDREVPLAQTHAKCALCHVMYQHLQHLQLGHYAETRHDWVMKLEKESVEETDYLERGNNPNSRFSRLFLNPRGNGHYLGDLCHFDVWAKSGSHASNILSTQPPVADHIEANNVIRRLIGACTTTHESCAAEEGSKLPHRVLRLSGTPEYPIVRLEEPGNAHGTYCALSHFWGKSENWPLRTTRDNIEEHLIGIPFEALSKTFQDTIVLLLHLNLEYLWVDSLCIIQDDRHDWETQAKNVGTIFTSAYLVLAAGDAEDSRDGLFLSNRENSEVLTLPYMDRGTQRGSWNMALRAHVPNWKSPVSGILRKRGWAFQEWYLAKRLIIFMRHGMYWKCAGFQGGERGTQQLLGMYESASWLSLMREYAGKDLTFASDRLIALEGIASQLQKSRTDAYHSAYGVWQDEIGFSLMWIVETADEAGNLPSLPSWCWAALGGRKWWILGPLLGEAHYEAEDVKVMNSGALAVKRVRIEVTDTLRPAIQACISLERQLGDVERQFLFNGRAGTVPGHLLWSPLSDSKCMGVARLDGGDPSHVEFVSFGFATRTIGWAGCMIRVGPLKHYGQFWDADKWLGTKPRTNAVDRQEHSREGYTRCKFCKAEYRTSSDITAANAVSEAQPDRSPGHKGHEKDVEETQMVSELVRLSHTAEKFYLGLLVEPAGQGKFRRVGIAMMYAHAYELSANTLDFEEIQII